MGKRRLYELAQERGLTSGELMERLERAGVPGKKPLSTVDEDAVDAALKKTARGKRSGGEKRPGGAKPPAAAAADGQPAEERPPPSERLRLRRRLRELRRLHDSQLQDLAGLAVELQRLDSPRYQELVGERMEAAAATDRELIALERQLAPDAVGGACPSCGLHSKSTRYCLRCGARLQGRRRSDTLSIPGAIVAVVAISAAWLLGGANLGTDTASHRTSAPTGQGAAVAPKPRVIRSTKLRTIVASVKGNKVGVYRSRDSGSPFTTLSNPNLDGAPLVFMVKSASKGWAHVMLPIRPNGSTGWIRLSRVKLADHSYRVLIDLNRHRLTAWRAGKVVLKTPVGVGRAVTPTPSGLYYITELLKQPDPTGLYGPFAFGLSAHSTVLHEFAGRDGILGIHGTNFPRGIGTDVSHGCIRMSNNAITKLARTLPAGTPVRIRRA